jgi:glycosyltransferase involved in cell wall biosynthesis
MLTVAHLANEFPSPVEPYVPDEIEELRSRGVRVVAGSVRQPKTGDGDIDVPDLILLPLTFRVVIRAVRLLLWRCKRISPFLWRIVFQGREGPRQRLRALVHTLLGVCYAVRLEGSEVQHIHVHHGYFGSWIGMAAARLLGCGFSMTLYGSDLLLRGAYLDTKLKNCDFCLTISEYNRQFVLQRYEGISADKVVVSRLGVELPARMALHTRSKTGSLHMLAIGRLHEVKDHAFLVRGCVRLDSEGVQFRCSIAGEGPERRRLELLIRACGLQEQITLLGYVPRDEIDSLYDWADVVVLTSRSEGIPLVLMEAMARGKIVVAPAITGIPELVIDGKTGFLYEPGSLDDFVSRLVVIDRLMRESAGEDRIDSEDSPASECRKLDWVRHGARAQVRHNFNREKNLAAFASLFLQRITPQNESVPREDSVLQQIQLSLQRNRSISV